MSISYQKILGRKHRTKCVSTIYQYNYWPKSVVHNAWVFFTNQKTSMRTSLIVGIKYSRFLYQNISAENGEQNAWVFSTNHKTTRDWVVSLVENTHAFCTRTIIGRKQGYKMRAYFLLENIEQKFGWKRVFYTTFFGRNLLVLKKWHKKLKKIAFPS